MKPEQRDQLRAMFPPETIGHVPRGGVQLAYVGHAAVTDRLLAVDPDWTWEPVAHDDDGLPLIQHRGKDAVLWIRMTVCGITRYGVGIVQATAFELEKQLISDAIRNAAMRYGVALDLWAKEDLGGIATVEEIHQAVEHRTTQPTQPRRPVAAQEAPDPEPSLGASALTVRGLRERAAALVAAEISVVDERKRRKLPAIRDGISNEAAQAIDAMLTELEQSLEIPF